MSQNSYITKATLKGEICQTGIPLMMHGEGVKITPDMIPDVSKQPEAMTAAAEAGKVLGQRLRNGHDRKAVTQAMQKKMMAVFASSA